MKVRIRLELGEAVDRFYEKPNRYLRKTELGNWCDRCRIFTDFPERHNHEQRPLD